MKMRHSSFSSDLRYVSSNVARSPETIGEGIRIYFNIMLGVLILYLLYTYLLPLF